jgi:DNA-binding NarL/FixJ family response regulator
LADHGEILSVTRILVVDDHGIVRDGIAKMLDGDSGIKIVGCAATGEEAVQASLRLKPDIVIMDLLLPGLNGIDATELILAQSLDIAVIVLSSSKALGHVQRALRAGARGYVLKSDESADLHDAIGQVLAGNYYISPAISAVTDLGTLLDAQESRFELLSARERDVLRRVVAGYTSADIGRQLSLSPKTIETYRCRLMLKLGVTDRAALIRLAMDFEVPSV